jgi:hypothetical protein
MAGQQVTLEYTGNANDIYGDYPGTVNGNPTYIVCDDWYDHVYTDVPWQATPISAASLNISNIQSTLFGLGGDGNILTPAQGVQLYTELAYLANVLLTAPGQPTAQTNPNATILTVGGVNYSSTDVAEAIWNLTSPYQSFLGGPTNFGGNSATLDTYVEGLASGGSIQLSQYSNLFIYAPIPDTQGGVQEMWSLPEGGTTLLYLLLAGAACFGTMLFVSTNRTRNRNIV